MRPHVTPCDPRWTYRNSGGHGAHVDMWPCTCSLGSCGIVWTDGLKHAHTRMTNIRGAMLACTLSTHPVGVYDRRYQDVVRGEGLAGGTTAWGREVDTLDAAKALV